MGRSYCMLTAQASSLVACPYQVFGALPRSGRTKRRGDQNADAAILQHMLQMCDKHPHGCGTSLVR
jgi:hypothetical protein